MSWWKKLFKGSNADSDTQEHQAPEENKSANGHGGCAGKAKEINLRMGTAEFELFMVQTELETGDNLPHGAEHLGNLLAYDPACPQWLELAEQYAKRVESPIDEKLIPVPEGQRYYTTEALRAWFWHYEGRLNEAVDLLIQVTRANPTPRYLDAWVLGWLEADNALEKLTPETAEYLFAVALNSFPEAQFSSAQQLAYAQRWARLIEHLPAPAPKVVAMRRMCQVGLLRKGGLLEEALEKAGPLEQIKSWNEAIALGLVLRQMKRLDESEKAFMHALKINPEDVSARLEAADSWLDNDHWEKALGWYEKALEAEPQHPWALPSSWYCQWKITSDEQWMDKIIAAIKDDDNSAKQRAIQLWYMAFGNLPEPYDATANVLRQVREKILETSDADSKDNIAQGDSIQIGLSSLEAPSNLLAVRLEMAALGSPTKLTLSVEDIPKPDPRVAKEPVEWLLWRYDGTDATPALPAPDEAVVEQIARLAATPYRPAVNWAAASLVAKQLGVEKAAQILATAVHPPAVPAGSYALAWLPRVQLCVMQVLAQLDSSWEDSVRRKALLSALFGPTDWTTSAAIIAMTWIAQNESAHALDIHNCFSRLETFAQETGYTCWQETLYQHWQDVPILYDNEREALQEKLQKLDDE